MANKKEHLTELAENVKAKRFINKYLKEQGVMPSVEDVATAKTLTQEEEARIDTQIQVDNLVKRASATEVAGVWDYIVDEASWNASYASGALKDYYVWADSIQPYKEDLWNEADQRPANWNDIVKDGEGNPIEFEDGYHYEDKNGNPCVRCWKGAFNAPGAEYPWCGVKFEPFKGIIKLEYEGEEVFPWGEEFRTFKRTFAIASIPGEFNKPEWKSDFNGNTTFDNSKLNVTRYVEE